MKKDQKDRPLHAKVMEKEEPVASRTRNRMGTHRARRQPDQYPFNWWDKSTEKSDSSSSQKDTKKDNAAHSGVSTDKLDEKDGVVENTAKRSANTKEVEFAKSTQYWKKQASSLKRVTKSLSEQVIFKPKQSASRASGLPAETSEGSKRSRKPRSGSTRRKYRTMRRRRSRQRNRRVKRTKRRPRGRARTTRKRVNRKANRSRAQRRKRLVKKLRQRRRSRKRVSRSRRRGRSVSRPKRKRVQRDSSSSSSCSDTERGRSPRRKRVLYRQDFFNKEQTQVLNEPHEINYDNTDKGHDEVKEDPLNDVCRNLVKEVHNAPADDRSDDKTKDKKGEKPELQKDKDQNNQQNRQKRRHNHHLKDHRHGHKKKTDKKKQKARRPPKRAPTKKKAASNPRVPNRRPYFAYQVMKDTQRNIQRYAKKVYGKAANRRSDRRCRSRRNCDRNNSSRGAADHFPCWIRWMGRLRRVEHMSRQFKRISCAKRCSSMLVLLGEEQLASSIINNYRGTKSQTAFVPGK